MSSHPTPGPWAAKSRATGGYNIVAVDDVLEDVVIGSAALGDHSLETAQANAQLLAAAPKMLALLMSVYAAAEVVEDTDWNESVRQIIDAVGAAP